MRETFLKEDLEDPLGERFLSPGKQIMVCLSCLPCKNDGENIEMSVRTHCVLFSGPLRRNMYFVCFL